MLLTPRREDSSRRLICHCRFAIVEVFHRGLRTSDLGLCALLPPLWRSTNTLTKARSGAQSQREVKNEDRTGYVHENKGAYDKMSIEKHAIYQENAPIEA